MQIYCRKEWKWRFIKTRDIEGDRNGGGESGWEKEGAHDKRRGCGLVLWTKEAGWLFTTTAVRETWMINVLSFSLLLSLSYYLSLFVFTHHSASNSCSSLLSFLCRQFFFSWSLYHSGSQSAAHGPVVASETFRVASERVMKCMRYI